MSTQKPFALPPAGAAFARAGASNVFEKDVLIEGRYQHPVTPWDSPLDVTKAMIERVCAASNAAINAGQRVYIPDTHSNRAKDNTGFVQVFFPRLAEGTWRATARMEITDPAYVPKIGTTIKDVSPMLVPFPLGDGRSFGERIEHVALVPDPVMPGQSDFVRCSVGPGTVDPVEVPVLKRLSLGEPPMKIKVTAANVKALSLAGVAGKDGDEVEVTDAAFERALSLAGEAESAKAAQKAAEDALAAEKAKPAPTVARLLSVDPSGAPFFAEAQGAKAKALSATLDAASSKGKITAGMRKNLERLLSVRHGYALSTAGVAEAVDVAAEAEALLAGIPDQAVVPVGQRTTPAAPPAPPPEGFTPADTKALVEKTLQSVGGKPKPAAK